jgi:hypothetical protein
MSDKPAVPDPAASDVGDLEYDLAHEVVDDAEARSMSTTHRPTAPIDVPTQTNSYDGGDYGYDMAHDNPSH